MANPKHGLGRGLGALIPTVAEEIGPGVSEAPIEAIVPNPHQPREKLDQEALIELADSIREHGIIQPLIVSRLPPEEVEEDFLEATPRYQLIAGERRLEAARMVGLATVPVLIREASPQETLELALVENLQRTDLNPLEEATAYQYLMDEFGLTQEAVAARVGKSRVAVANVVRLLKLPQVVKAALAEGEISEGHARALLPLDSEKKQSLALKAIRERALSVRQTEELVRRLLADTGLQPARQQPSPETRALEERFSAALSTKVNLFRSQKGGRVVIHFYSEEELENIYNIIAGGSR
jgi:ParB family chromosome partitioning protein